MNEYDWKERGSASYYHNVSTGKIVGTVSKLMSNDIWIGLVLWVNTHSPLMMKNI